MLAALVLLPLLARLGRAAAQGTVPGLEELGSDWVDFGTGATVPTQSGPEPIPIDCPSISNVFGSVGSCEPGCPDLLSFNSWTAGPYQQGTCAARVRLDGVPVNVSRHQWLPYQVVREGTAGRFSFTSAMRMLEDAAGTPGILLNLTVTSTAGELGRDGELAPSELKIDLAPELQLLSDMPWNINWPPAKAGWTHTVEQGGRLLLSRDTTTQAVTALGIMQVAPSALYSPSCRPRSIQSGLGLTVLRLLLRSRWSHCADRPLSPCLWLPATQPLPCSPRRPGFPLLLPSPRRGLAPATVGRRGGSRLLSRATPTTLATFQR